MYRYHSSQAKPEAGRPVYWRRTTPPGVARAYPNPYWAHCTEPERVQWASDVAYVYADEWHAHLDSLPEAPRKLAVELDADVATALAGSFYLLPEGLVRDRVTQALTAAVAPVGSRWVSKMSGSSESVTVESHDGALVRVRSNDGTRYGCTLDALIGTRERAS